MPREPLTASKVIEGLISESTSIRLPLLPPRKLKAKFALKMSAKPINEDDNLVMIDPWEKADLSWSDEIGGLKKKALAAITSDIKLHDSFDANSVKCTFKTIRLQDKKIAKIDPKIIEYKNLENLSLNGNLLTKIDASNLPLRLTILSLNANQLSEIPQLSSLVHLIHLGMTHNKLKNIANIEKCLPFSLKSLDLAWNHIEDLKQSVNALKKCGQLQLLSLMGNKVSLMKSYRRLFVSNIPKLIIFDDTKITNEERMSNNEAGDSESDSELIVSFIAKDITVSDLRGLPGIKSPTGSKPNSAGAKAGAGGKAAGKPAPAAAASAQPPDEDRFYLELSLAGFPEKVFTSNSVLFANPMRFEPVINMNFPIDNKVCNSIREGWTIRLKMKRLTFVVAPEEERPDSAAGDKKKAAAKPAKGKKTISYVATEVESKEIASATISVSDIFIGGEMEVMGEWGDEKASNGKVQFCIGLNRDTVTDASKTNVNASALKIADQPA